MNARAHRFPRLRWWALAWAALWLPVYAQAYGAWHFLFLCNLGLALTIAGIVLDRPLLLSSQMLAAPLLAALFALDLGVRLASGRSLHGGAAHLWDESLPVLVRALSLYHLAWPIVLAWCIARTGYDRRGLALQLALACSVFAIGLWLAPASENLNYVLRTPEGVPHANAPLQAALMLGGLALAAWWPLHLLLRRCFAAPLPYS